MQEHKIKKNLEQSHNTIESRCESVVLKGWFVPPGVKLGVTDSLGQTTPHD